MSPERAEAGACRSPLIGPGSLVLIVGPSGAGKDTLIAYARERLAGEAAIVFPRRTVTREADPALEDHAAVSAEMFDRMTVGGGFALHWHANGLSYGVPAEIDDSIAAGRMVVVNVSRGVVSTARNLYVNVLPVQITAPPEILADRLLRRGRERGKEIGRRLMRAGSVDSIADAAEIVNDGPVEAGGEALVALLLDRLRRNPPLGQNLA